MMMIMDHGGENLAVGTGGTGNNNIEMMTDKSGSAAAGATTVGSEESGIVRTIMDTMNERNGKIVVSDSGMKIMDTRNSARALAKHGGARAVERDTRQTCERPRIGSLSMKCR